MKYRVTLTCKSAAPVGSEVTLQKEPENGFDNEAIRVLVDGEPQGYVAQYYKLREPGTISAGRLVDKIPALVKAKVTDFGIAEVDVPDGREVGS